MSTAVREGWSVGTRNEDEMEAFWAAASFGFSEDLLSSRASYAEFWKGRSLVKRHE